jgi:hypothetical protein
MADYTIMTPDQLRALVGTDQQTAAFDELLRRLAAEKRAKEVALDAKEVALDAKEVAEEKLRHEKATRNQMIQDAVATARYEKERALRYEVFMRERALLIKSTRPCRFTDYLFTLPQRQ